jgi:hypothetical protein
MLTDGQPVTYVGVDPQRIGDRGRVLQGEQGGAHVLWQTGARLNNIEWTDDEDLAPFGKVAHVDGLDDSLEYGIVSTSAVRQAMEDGGEVAVLNFMAEHGHLAGFQAIAEEALQFIAARIRAEEAVRSVTAQLDEDEAAALVSLAAHVLVRDAFSDED